MPPTIPPGGTLLDTFRKSFTDVPIDAEKGNAVATTEFLDACESLTTFFDMLGNAFLLPKKDMVTNITKLRTRQLAAPLQSENVQDLCRNELKEGKHEATQGLLWLMRGLEFTCASLSANIANATEEVKASFTEAYKNTLRKHHGWVVRGAFDVAMTQCPYRKDFYAKLGDDTEKVISEMREYLKALDKIVGILFAFVNSKEAQW